MSDEPWRERVYYAEPAPADRVRPGDIVEYDDHSWDVRGWDTLSPREPDGHQPVVLRLERVEQKQDRAGRRRSTTITERVDERRVRLLARQHSMPAMPEAAPEERVRHYQ